MKGGRPRRSARPLPAARCPGLCSRCHLLTRPARAQVSPAPAPSAAPLPASLGAAAGAGGGCAAAWPRRWEGRCGSGLGGCCGSCRVKRAGPMRRSREPREGKDLGCGPQRAGSVSVEGRQRQPRLPPVDFIIFYYIAWRPVEIVAVLRPSRAPAGGRTWPGAVESQGDWAAWCWSRRGRCRGCGSRPRDLHFPSHLWLRLFYLNTPSPRPR